MEQYSIKRKVGEKIGSTETAVREALSQDADSGGQIGNGNFQISWLWW